MARVSESEIQRILEKLDELKDELRDQSIAWHHELNKVQLRCAVREETTNRMKIYMDEHKQNHGEWLEGVIGKRVLMALSGLSGAILYIFAERLVMTWLK